MAQPNPYVPSFSFSDFQSASPSEPLPGDRLDIELAEIKQTLDEVRANLALLQRDDGSVANGVVTLDSISTDLLPLLGDFNPRGTWQADTLYAFKDVVYDSGQIYVAVAEHTSDASDIAVDIAANRWLAFDTSLLRVDADDVIPGFLDTKILVSGLTKQVVVDGGQRKLEITSPDVRRFGVATSSSPGVLEVTVPATISAYQVGEVFHFQSSEDGDGSPKTINFNGVGAVALEDNGGASPSAGDLINGQLYSCVHDGTNFRLLSPETALTTRHGLVQFAVQSSMESLVDNRAVTPDMVGFSPRVSTFKRVEVFTTSGTFTKDADCKYVEVVCVGGGGSGGSIPATSGGQGAESGGGAAGSTSFKTLAASSLGATETVTIGAGASPASAGANAGNTGGDTSFGTLCVAKGGQGGGAGTAAVDSEANGGEGVGGGTGDLEVIGGPGRSGRVISANPSFGNGGGSSTHGHGGRGNSDAGQFYGGGGSGASSFASASAEAGAGGAAGLVIVKVYH